MKVVERWPEDGISPWVKGVPPVGYFRGIAINVSNEKEGWQTALDDAKKQICSCIGFETREEYERKVTAYNNQVDKRVIAEFKCTSAAILEDIDSSIKDTYFEKWMQKTRYGKEYFANYYVLVYYPQTKINGMKTKTEEENEKRLTCLGKCLSFAKQEKEKGNFFEALRGYVYALFIADTLFRDREIHALECKYRIATLVSSLHLLKVSNYSEKPNSMQRVSVRASIDNVPAVNVPVRFEINSGEGKLEQIVFTDKDGIASSTVQMSSVREDNRIRAFIDLIEIISADNRLLVLNEIKEVEFIFSTLSKFANVQAGTLYVEKQKAGFLKKIPVLKFDLTEVNVLGATFDRYDIEVKGLFKHKHWLTGRTDSWSRSEVGSFNLDNKIEVKGKGKTEGVLEWNVWLADTFKGISNEKYCKEIQLILTLYGKDNNENSCKVIIQSTPIAVNSR
ncbi:hypothetical protein MUO65_03715 [bacterium]|nr:hypothetical protein [bacterium]